MKTVPLYDEKQSEDLFSTSSFIFAAICCHFPEIPASGHVRNLCNIAGTNPLVYKTATKIVQKIASEKWPL